MTNQEAIYLLNNLRAFAEEDDNPAIDMAIEALYKPTSDDLIIKGAKGIKDGLYNIQNGELFQYKAKGGTVRAYPIVEALQDDWVPVSERLPKTNGIFNVTRRISDGFECRNITDACYFDGSSTWHDDTRVNHERKNLADVIAWRPLPGPYKESEDE